MALALRAEGMDYLLEGAQMLPARVGELVVRHPSVVRACFLGYAGISPVDKLQRVRRSMGQQSDWLLGRSDQELLALFADYASVSAYHRDECARRGLRYFDISEDFEGAFGEAARYLTTGSRGCASPVNWILAHLFLVGEHLGGCQAAPINSVKVCLTGGRGLLML